MSPWCRASRAATGSRRTDNALHTPAELLQPVILVAIAGAVGVGAGRLVKRTVLAIVVGVFAWTVLFPLAWVWNNDVSYPVALVQTMPLRVPLPEVRSFADTPAGWWVESPGRYHRDFGRQLVHQPTVLLHDVFLLGVLAAASATSLVRHRRVACAIGGLLIVVGVSGQWMVSPL